MDALGESLETRYPTANDCYLYGLSPERTVERIPTDAVIIGINFGFSFEWPYSRDLAWAIRVAFPNALLVGGGEHVTAVPEQSLKNGPLDAVVLGEGEETIVEVARVVAAGARDLAGIPGIAYKRDDDIFVNPRRGRARDIDSIALPAWDLFPIRSYLEAGVGFGVNRGRSMPVLASRGCPYQCTFCSSPSMWTTRWVARDPDLLLDEMAHYQKVYGAQNFDFYDLTAIVKKSWIVSFCRKIKQRGMSFTWQLPSGTRSEAIDAEVARLLYESGCRNLSYSPESGSPEILARIKKRIDIDTVIASITACRRMSMNVKCNIILGFPGETLRHVLETYRFIARMGFAGAYDISIWAFSPYPGSELFAEIARRDRLVFDDAYYNSLRSYADPGRSISYSENFSDLQLRLLRFVGTAVFYGAQWTRRPWRPLRLVYNVLRKREESRSEMALLGMLRRRRLTAAPAPAFRAIPVAGFTRAAPSLVVAYPPIRERTLRIAVPGILATLIAANVAGYNLKDSTGVPYVEIPKPAYRGGYEPYIAAVPPSEADFVVYGLIKDHFRGWRLIGANATAIAFDKFTYYNGPASSSVEKFDPSLTPEETRELLSLAVGRRPAGEGIPGYAVVLPEKGARPGIVLVLTGSDTTRIFIPRSMAPPRFAKVADDF